MRHRPILIWTAVFLIALDLMARGIAAQLPAPRVFASYNIQRQAERVERVDSECLDTVLLGTSLMGAAARTTEILDQLDDETTATNAAVGGGGLLILDAWIRDLILPSTCPTTAIIGLGPRDANDSFRGPEATLEAYLASTGRRRIVGDLDLFGHLDNVFERSLGLFQLRTAYREPANAAAFFLNGSGDWRRATDDSGQITFFADDVYTPSADREEALAGGAFTEFTVGGRNFEALDSAIDTLQQAGVNVIVVDMPRVEPAHLRLVGRTGLDLYETALADVAERRGVSLLQADEVSVLQDDGVFADEYHLNRAGSRAFSEWLGMQLADR